jgi:hypothetical protein
MNEVVFYRRCPSHAGLQDVYALAQMLNCYDAEGKFYDGAKNEDIDRLMLGANYKVIRWISSPRYAARAYDEMIIAK